MSDDGTTQRAQRPNIRGAIGWIAALSLLLSPLLLLGPFIAGYAGGRKAKSAPAALVAALGPALIWVAAWWWIATHEVALGSQKITPVSTGVLAPTTGLAILGGAFAGSGGRLAHVIGLIAMITAVAWVWPSGKEIYALFKLVQPETSQQAVVENRTCPDRLKKLYDAAMLYSDSWDGHLPPAESWVTALRDPSQPFGEEEFVHCPDVSTGTDDKYGYAMNRELGGKRVSEIRDKGTTPLFFDSGELDKNAATAPAEIASSGRHGGKSNVVFADGTVGQR